MPFCFWKHNIYATKIIPTENIGWELGQRYIKLKNYIYDYCSSL